MVSSSQRNAALRVPAIAAPREVFLFPPSYGQQRLWLVDRLLPTGSVYNVARVFRLSGALNVAALEAALNDVVERHEALRTRFGLEDRGPMQLIASELRLAVEVEDLRGVAPGEREAEARRRAQEEAEVPFDLAEAPLVRMRLLRTSENEHWLLLTLHHIITDGWSSGVLVRELSALYRAHCLGEASPLSPLPVQYADYAVWQREWLQGEVLEQQLAYWKPALADLPALELPTDRPRPAVASFRGGRVHVEIGEALTRDLKALGRAERATLFMTLLAALQVLLYRYSGQEDVAVGAPISGRVRPELNELIGFFVNTLVLRGDLSGEPSFREYLARVRARALDAYAHQDLPFEKLVEELHPKRDMSRNPLFQVALAMQNTPPGELQLVGLDVHAVTDVAGESAKFDLSISVAEAAGTLRMRLEYATDLFDAATIERMAGHWQVLLEGIVADPEQSISRLPLLTAAERRQQLVEWNATAADYPRERCLHELFEQQVERTPEAMAAVFGDQQLTYAELNARANRLAHHLRGLGVGPDVLVGLCVERSLDLVVGLMGILKAGGAYLPLDPSYPTHRLAFMLADTQAPVLLTQERLLPALPSDAGRVLCLDREWGDVARDPATNPVGSATATNLAYVIYTSGSTGQPKGVMIEHRSVVNYLCWLQREFPLTSADRVLQSTPTSFDISVLELFLPLLTGAQLEVAESRLQWSPHDLIEYAGRREVTVLQVVPSLLSAIVDGPGLARLKSLRRVFSVGETLVRELVRRFHDQTPAELVNGYGPTETTVYSTFWACDRKDERQVIPIGRPLSNTRILVLDAHRALVPVGRTGEVYIGGHGVARGYLGRPELTAERFVVDPFSDEPDARVYATGDIARYLPDGNLEFLGRRDHQVKIRGFRIELGEIEATLAQHPSVMTAVAMVREDVPGDSRVVAYLLTRDASAPTARQVREFARARLPEHMVPAAFVMLDRFPMTPSGKIDRGGFAPPGAGSTVGADAYVAPRDDTERVLCRMWSEVLHVPQVGLDDNFFEIGGHSLLGARLFAQLDEEFGRALPLGLLFETPTVRKLAEYLRSSTPLAGCVSLVPITQGSSRPAVFAVPGVGGNVLGFADLARAMGADQAFFGLQSPGLDGAREPLESIEDMARLYVSEVRSVRPRGPYALIGACFGATVAYEMARQIAESGEEVALLGLFDPSSLGGEKAGRRSQPKLRVVRQAKAAGGFVQGRLQLYRREMANLGHHERIAYVGRKLRTFLRRMSRGGSLEGVRLEMNQMKVYRANVAALRRFERKAIDGRVRVLAIFETARRSQRHAAGEWWTNSGGEVVRLAVDGDDSGDMLNGAHAKGLAVELSRQLKKAFDRG